MPELTPTPTSYAVLGLLALRPWSTYELARQSERSLRWFFPRAERAVYLEAKRLVELGWASGKKTATGRRSSTVYRITANGRRALRAWLGAPSPPTQIESEAAMKVFFADQAGIAELRANVDAVRQEAARSLAALGAMAGGEQAFPDRTRTNVLSMRLVTDLHDALHRWAEWAAGAVDVLAGGDETAIAEQTRQVLSSIRDAAAPDPG